MSALLAGGGTALTIIGATGTDLLFRTITTTSSGIITALRYITSMDSPSVIEVKNDLEKLDLEDKIKIISSLVDNLENNKNIVEYIKLSLDSVINILQKISEELFQIQQLVEQHNSLYFNSYRTLNCISNITNLENHSLLFDKRIDLLIKLLSI